MSRSRKRNKYYKSRAIDKSCRCHGSCDYCRGNRLAAVKRQEETANITVMEYEKEPIPGFGNFNEPYWVRSLRHG